MKYSDFFEKDIFQCRTQDSKRFNTQVYAPKKLELIAIF